MARERLDACIFYSPEEASGGLTLSAGTYVVDILEGTTVVGTTDLILR